MPTQEFIWVPSYDSSVTKKPNVKTVQFGDGYEVRTPIGINNNPRSYSLVFKNRANATADAIDAFLEARSGSEAFLWAPPNATWGMWVCREWNVTPTSPTTKTISATFDQVYEAVV